MRTERPSLLVCVEIGKKLVAVHIFQNKRCAEMQGQQLRERRFPGSYRSLESYVWLIDAGKLFRLPRNGRMGYPTPCARSLQR